MPVMTCAAALRSQTTVLNKAISKPVSRAKIRKHQEKQNKRLIAQVPTSDLQTIMCFAVDQQPLTTRVESAAQVDGPNDEINKQVEDVDMSLKSLFFEKHFALSTIGAEKITEQDMEKPTSSTKEQLKEGERERKRKACDV